MLPANEFSTGPAASHTPERPIKDCVERFAWLCFHISKIIEDGLFAVRTGFTLECNFHCVFPCLLNGRPFMVYQTLRLTLAGRPY
jgi:hypothetical protein